MTILSHIIAEIRDHDCVLFSYQSGLPSLFFDHSLWCARIVNADFLSSSKQWILDMRRGLFGHNAKISIPFINSMGNTAYVELPLTRREIEKILPDVREFIDYETHKNYELAARERNEDRALKQRIQDNFR